MLTPIDLYHQLEPISLEQFGSLFSSMKSSTFRLEMLDLYTVEGEQAAFHEFLSGKKFPPEDFNESWTKLISESVTKGIEFKRVRLLNEPISDYVKFEISWCYKINIAAGDSVSAIFSKITPDFDTKVPILKDYWIFDDEDCYLMEYDLLGQFLGVNKVPHQAVDDYVKLKYEAIEKSKDIRSTELWNELL